MRNARQEPAGLIADIHMGLEQVEWLLSALQLNPIEQGPHKGQAIHYVLGNANRSLNLFRRS